MSPFWGHPFLLKIGKQGQKINLTATTMQGTQLLWLYSIAMLLMHPSFSIIQLNILKRTGYMSFPPLNKM